jgi:hypothetical protein
VLRGEAVVGRDERLSRAEAAALVGVTKRTLLKWEQEPQYGLTLRSYFVGNAVFYTRADLELYLRKKSEARARERDTPRPTLRARKAAHARAMENLRRAGVKV